MKRYMRLIVLSLICGVMIVLSVGTILANSVREVGGVQELSALVIRPDHAIIAAFIAAFVGVLIFTKRNYVGKSTKEETN